MLSGAEQTMGWVGSCLSTGSRWVFYPGQCVWQPSWAPAPTTNTLSFLLDWVPAGP